MAFLETGAFVGLIAPGEFTVIVGGVIAGIMMWQHGRVPALHATLLQCEHPGTREVLRFESELPPALAAVRVVLAADASGPGPGRVR